MNPEQKKVNSLKKKYRVLRIIGRILLVILLLVFLLLLFIRSEWGQSVIVDKVTSYVSDKTNTRVEIDRLFISFDGDIIIEELFLDDPSGDTLIYSRYLEADIPLWPILRGTGIGIENLESQGLRANIIRQDTVNGFNFQFLIDALAPDTTPKPAVEGIEAPTNFILGSIHIRDADIIYDDGVTGIDSHFIVGNMELSMEATDLENMQFSAYEGLVENTVVEYTQNPIAYNPNAEETPLPLLSLETLMAKNVTGFYNLIEAGMLVNFRAPELHAEIPKANLAENTFNLRTLSLKNGLIDIAMKDLSDANKLFPNAPKTDSPLWPAYNADINALDITNTSISYSVNGAQAENGVFDPDAVYLRRVDLEATNLYLKEKALGINIQKMNGTEGSGLNLKSLVGDYTMTDTYIKGESVAVALNQNKISGRFEVSYQTLQNLIDNPEEAQLYANFPIVLLDINDIFRFQPSLRNNEYMSALSQYFVSGTISASGSMSEVDINNLQLRWSDTRISGIGTVTNASNPDLLGYGFPRFSMTSQRSDIIKFVNEEELSIKLPEQLLLEGSLRGNMNSITTDAVLKTNQGLASVKGNFQVGEPIKFDTNITITQYDLGALLLNEQLGLLSGTIQANGIGNTINSLNAVIDAKIDSFAYNGYVINDLPLKGNIKNGKGTLDSKYKDENLNIVLNSTVELDSVAPEIRANLNIIGADLQALGLMNQDVRGGVEIDAFFKGNATQYNANAVFNDGVIVSNNETYLVGSLEARMRVRPDTTTVVLQNKMLDINLQSNSDPARFATAVQDHIYGYFYRDTVIPDTIAKPVHLKVRGKIAQTALLNEVFLVNVKDLDTINVMIDFVQSQRKLDVSIQAPHINYGGNELDSLSFTMNTDADNFNFDLGFNAIKAGPVSIGRTTIQGRQANNELALDFLAYDVDNKLIHVKGVITGSRERLRIHIEQDELIFNRELWTTPDTNEVLITDQNLEFNDFRFKRNSQEVNFSSEFPNIVKDHLGIEFVNFKLQEFLAYFNPDEELATGNLSGDFVIEEPFGDLGLLADLRITDLGLMTVDMGTLDLSAKSLGGNRYDFSMDITGGAIDLELLGDYIANEEGALLNMDLKIDEFKMAALNGFSQGEIVDGSGSFTGDFSINGKIAEPVYDGQLRFNNAGFKIAKLNAAFTLPQEIIDIDNNGFTMDGLTLKDENGNTMVARGKIGTKSFLNPTFDLKIEAKNFQALNATEDDNDIMYGTAIIDASATIKGNLEIPKIDLKGSVTSKTDVTYVMPASTTNIESRDGIVIFVNRKNPNAILTRNEEESATITGYDIKALVDVVDGAKVKIILDPSTGDNVEVTGEGEFNFTMLPNGRMNLTGGYDMSGGQYSMNLYNLVNRTFEIAPESRISWSGDPFDANLDVRAIYKLETSASALMAPTSSGTDPSIKGRYRQVLPFYVYLNVDGELLAPKLSFALDMPEDEQGAIGGQVYGRVQQVNTQEGELNRQVFSLLVLNRFYPDPGSDGSRGGFANIARDNINDALSDQLNVFSDKLLGKTGVEVNFGLDSYTDYQGETPQERTQLDIAAQKKLFNDRLIVTVGSAVDVQGDSPSGESTPIVGNVSLEYVLTNDGRYRIKGFRRNEFENVIDGQTIVSGIALIFTQEFNQFSELWDAILRSKTKQLREEEEKLKAADAKLEKQEEEQDQENRGIKDDGDND